MKCRFMAALMFWGLLTVGCQSPVELEMAKQDFIKMGDALYVKGHYKEAYNFYNKGIPSYTTLQKWEMGNGAMGRGGDDRYSGMSPGGVSSTRMRVAESPGHNIFTEDQLIISIDNLGEECFYKAMDCLVKLGKYNAAISNYERYLSYFPNYHDMDNIVNNIKTIIGKYEDEGEEGGAVRGYKLLLRIDSFNKDGRDALYQIANYQFKEDRFFGAIRYYEDILAFFPNDPLIPDVLFRLGEANYELFRGIYYDDKYIKNGEKYFLKFLERSDDKAKKKSAQHYLNDIREKMAAKIFYKGKFYYRRKQLVSARSYFREVIDQYKETSWAVEAASVLASMPSEKKTEEEK